MHKVSPTFRLVAFLLVIITGFLAITGLSVLGLKKALFEQKTQQTRYLVENAHSLLEYFYQLSSHNISEQEAKQRAISTIEALRYDTHNYFWINDTQPKMIAHPYSRELIDKDLSQLQDPDGKYLFNDFVKIVNTHGEGMVPYLWPKPGNSEPVKKISYVKLFAPWGWVIGSGVYVDDVEEAFWSSAILLGIITTSMLLLLATATVTIRREAAFQENEHKLIEDSNIRLEQQVSERTSDLQQAHSDLINQTQQQAESIKQLQAAQEQLLQSEKLASIGQLSAGIAHEINNPVGFIASNINTASNYMNQLIAMLELIKTNTAALDNSAQSQQIITEAEKQYDFNYLKQDLSDLFTETKDGVLRIQKIIADLKGFARASDGSWEHVDLHKEIDSTLNVIWNELKYHCTIDKQYGDIPPVECLRSEISQVIMNLLINASQAITDQGVIRIRTGANNSHVWVIIEDNGKGIDPQILHRIFDPFFTTKPVGKGTGLGLSVSYGIIEKHNGTLEASSTPGVGTVFTMTLPLQRSTTT